MNLIVAGQSHSSAPGLVQRYVRPNYYIELAASGLRMPIGADLVLHEEDDPEVVACDGRRLGEVLRKAAERYRTPLAVPLMDLRLEKADLLRALGIPGSEVDAFHFTHPPEEAALETAESGMDAPFARRNQAHIDSIRYVAGETELVPVGMAIGPFSLTTKLMADPITAVALSGMGLTGEEEPGVLTLERCHALACKSVERSLAAQIAAGARAVIVCEPAANVVYFSPKHLEAGAGTFERFVIRPLLMLKRQLENAGADFILHDCGELTGGMVREFGCRVRPAVLSLGSSRKLWEDAALVPKDVVLFGNLPTKSFYSDSVMNAGKVREITCELLEKMRAAGHPFILGSECDVLHVPEAAETIRNKVDVMLSYRLP